MKGEKLLQYISIFTSFILLYGVFFNWYYYKHFNIDITEYIELSEILLLFFPSTPTILFFMVLWLMLYWIIIIPESLEIETLSNHPIYSFFYRNKELRLKRFLIFLVISTSLICSFYFFNKKPISIGYNQIFSTLALILFAILVPINIIIFISISRVLSGLQNKLTISTILTLIFYLFIGIVFAADMKANKALSVRNSSEVTLYFENGNKLSTDSSLVYLGKTKHYCFLYNKLTNESESISMTIIGRIITKPRKPRQ